MTILQIVSRLCTFSACCIGLIAAAWLLLEWAWDRLLDHINELRRRAQHARRIAGYNRAAARHGRTVRG